MFYVGERFKLKTALYITVSKEGSTKDSAGSGLAGSWLDVFRLRDSFDIYLWDVFWLGL